MYNSIWVMLHKFSVFSMFLNWWLLDFASCVCGVCVWCVCVCVCVCRLSHTNKQSSNTSRVSENSTQL